MRVRVASGVALFVVVSLLAVPSVPGATRNRHWIGVRQSGGELELFDRRTGDHFVPRGANLLMKVPEGDHVASGLFRPRDWNPRKVDAELRRMANLDFDTVRVFIDLCQVDCISTANGSIRPAYAKNIAAFLEMARDRGLVVMLASADVPDLGYSDRLPCCSPFGGYRNSLWLASEGHDLLVEYWTEVVEALKREGAPLDVVIYEIQQEQWVQGDVEPLSLDSGTVTTADGETYDMASPADRTTMVESNVRLGAERVRGAIRGLDSGALVTMGAFPQPPGDTFLVPSLALLESSTLDLVDLHLYPGIGSDQGDQVDAIGLSGLVDKPLVMGELGAFRFAYANPRVGAYALAHFQALSCQWGFEGWLVWLWAKVDDEVFGAREGGGAIANILSPQERPDPCSAQGVPTNVAPLGTATASASLPDEPPGNAIDGSVATQWGAGGSPPQWIEIDLETVRTIQEIDLLVGQFPEGDTHHRLFLAGADGVFGLVAEFQGFTAQGDALSFVPEVPVDARFVRVETVSSPSWVAWPEIQVYA